MIWRKLNMKEKYVVISKIVLILMLFLFWGRVDALKIGIDDDNSNVGPDDWGYSEKYKGSFVVRTGGKNSILVSYGENANDSQELAKVKINLNLSAGVQVTATNTYMQTGDTLSGSGSSYEILLKDGVEHDDMMAANFTIKFPSISELKLYKVTITATGYDKNNTKLSTKEGVYSYYIIPNNYLNSCNNDSSVKIVTDVGEVNKVTSFAYAVSTKKSSANIKITPNSSTTLVEYMIGESEKVYKLNSDNSTGALNLEYGENQITVLASSECDIKKEKFWDTVGKSATLVDVDYDDFESDGEIIFLVINREDDRSKVNTLKSLFITDAVISFKPELKSYIVSVPYKVSSVKISSTLTDSKSSYVNGYGNREVSLKEGTNDVLIKVKAENGSVATYTIKITRDENDDASLKSLAIGDKVVPLQDNLLVYEVSVENDVVYPPIKAVANDSKAKVEVEEIGALEEGDNEVNITVTAANGMKNVYVVNIVRDKLISNNSKLKDIIIEDNELNFNSNTFEYELYLAMNEKNLNIQVITDHEKAKYIITGNKNLKNGSVIKIKVTAEDGEATSTYSIKIKKDSIWWLYLLLIIPGGFIVILVFAIINKSKKNKNNINNIVYEKIPETQLFNAVSHNQNVNENLNDVNNQNNNNINGNL